MRTIHERSKVQLHVAYWTQGGIRLMFVISCKTVLIEKVCFENRKTYIHIVAYLQFRKNEIDFLVKFPFVFFFVQVKMQFRNAVHMKWDSMFWGSIKRFNTSQVVGTNLIQTYWSSTVPLEWRFATEIAVWQLYLGSWRLSFFLLKRAEILSSVSSISSEYVKPFFLIYRITEFRMRRLR